MNKPNALPKFALITSMVLAVLLAGQPSYATDEADPDKTVQEALLKRTLAKCDRVLPAWFDSETGTGDYNVRRYIVDCYTGHARLAVLGVETDFQIAETSLAELPSMLLTIETGMDLDIYRPLSGRSFASGNEPE
jgi:hypothetical protein